MKLAQTLVIAWFLTRIAIHALYHGDVIKPQYVDITFGEL